MMVIRAYTPCYRGSGDHAQAGVMIMTMILGKEKKKEKKDENLAKRVRIGQLKT